MTVPSVNLTLDKGTDFEAIFTVTNSDGSIVALNNHSAISKIRKYPSSESYKSFQTTITTSTGEIKVSMAASITSQLPTGRSYYDVTILQSTTGKITKVFEGMILIKDTVSV